MSESVFGGTSSLSSWSFRFATTLVVLMLPVFFVGRFTQLAPQPANLALGALAIGAAAAALVGTVAAIWRK
jgi:hypothetical protein